MPIDDEPHDERPAPRPPLPADDRLWRHPSELGVHGPIGASTHRSGSSDRSPAPISARSAGSSGDRGARVLALGVVLVGAVVTVGTFWLTRPGQGHAGERATAARGATTTLATGTITATTTAATATTAIAAFQGNSLFDAVVGHRGDDATEPAPHAHLGVRAVDDTTVTAAGARLTEVDAGGPAASAGLQVGDVVTSMAGASITDASDLLEAVRSRAPGDEVAVEVRRGADALHLTVHLG